MKMKSFKILALALAALIVLPSVLGCSPRPLDEDPDHHLPTETSGGTVKARTLALPGTPLKTEPGWEVSEELREAVWRFAGKTSKAALEIQKADENTLYSPVSLYYALGMLEAGTGGETKTRLRDFMEVSLDLPLGPEFQKLYARMTHEDEFAAEQTANSVWIKDSLVSERSVEQDWLDQLSEHFYASAFAVDFSDPQTAKDMSAWVEKETKGKIKPEMDLSDPLLLMVLMNTVYFQAEWVEGFEKNEVVTDRFFAQAGPVQVPYLTRYIMGYQGIRNDRYAAASLPLKRGQIDFILPAEGLDPAELLADPDFLFKLWTAEREEFDLDFKIPKFKYETKTDLLNALEEFGLGDLLGFDADFSGIYDGDIAVSAISQETFIALDEKGVEAAAMTDIHFAGSAAPVHHELLELHLDRPFLFVISDPAGVPLFVGIVRNPA